MGADDGDTPGILSVKQSLAGGGGGKLTVTQVAAQLQKFADDGTAAVAQISAGSDKELASTVSDIRAMADLGRYYAEKILGALEYARPNKASAIAHLQTASAHWKSYAAELTSQYVSGQVLTRMFSSQAVDFNAIQANVDNDIKLAGGP